MCGIAAIVAPQSGNYQGALQQMMKALKHRGPDGDGMHLFHSCALGHTRLSVVDIDGGSQPMLSAASPTGITFNGEIYDYRSIRASLDQYPFLTSSDTEVILALYEQYGPQCPRYLNGMFAFALWDDAKQELLCARDRFGEKPLYYATGVHGELLVTSEIKAIVASGLVRPVLNKSALAHYLKYLCVHANETIFSNIHVLPPAHAMRYRNGQLTIERYWHVPPPATSVLSLQDAALEFQRLFNNAVERCMIADVPVGLFLSGGLDSSSVVAIASQYSKGIKTFFFDFEKNSTERGYARDVAQIYGTDHIELSDARAPIADLLVEMQGVFDEPFADSSNIPTWLLARSARQYLKVVLAGDGADELLGGYTSWYRSLWYMEQASQRAHADTSLLRLAAHYVEGWFPSAQASLSYQRAGIEYRQRYRGVGEAHQAQRTYFSDEQLAILGLSADDPFTIRSHVQTLDDVLREDVEDYLPSDILTKVDRASMAHGLEVRSPFLDVELASFCVSQPVKFKINGRTDKLLLREALSHAWPASVRRRGKQGFGAPITEWLKRDDVTKLKKEYLDNPKTKVFSVLPFEHTRDFVDRDDYLTWILLVLAVWMDRHDFALGS
ncbi:MAG TPA: asparagine synthase (glutamine-hydrolyzing) [Nitrospiraceae bacterium]|nr:asparagine synthase (glutamine-hydrolyzing) [Nitrospiraceae bacterium]